MADRNTVQGRTRIYSEVDDKCNLALELLEVIPVIQFAYGHDQIILYVSM